jgi:hypothetical protein
VFAANYEVPTPTKMTTAISDMEIAYTDAASRPSIYDTNEGEGDISGLILEAGVHTFTININVGDGKSVTLNGGPCDVFIFQTTGSVVIGSGAKVLLTGGIKASVRTRTRTQLRTHTRTRTYIHMHTLAHTHTHTHTHIHKHTRTQRTQNVFWQVAGAVSVGTTAHMEGTILSFTDVTFKTESNLNGKILSQTSVALQKVDFDESTTLRANEL